MRLDQPAHQMKSWSYPQFKREIPAIERIEGYRERIRTQSLDTAKHLRVRRLEGHNG